jgi:hypothetical protein
MEYAERDVTVTPGRPPRASTLRTRFVASVFVDV